MPLLYGIIVICAIVWCAAKFYEVNVIDVAKGPDGDGYRDPRHPDWMPPSKEGEVLFGFKCDLVGEEYKVAKKQIEDELAKLEAGLHVMLEKYGRQVMRHVAGLGDWRGHDGYTCAKKDKEGRAMMLKLEKEWDAINQNGFFAAKHPIIRKYDRQQTFKEKGWGTRHPYYKKIFNKVEIII